MINHIEELKSCKTIPDLIRFSIRYAGRDKYSEGFMSALRKEKDFQKAQQRVWNYALQKDGKYFLGREGFVRFKGSAIAGMECHSGGHR